MNKSDRRRSWGKRNDWVAMTTGGERKTPTPPSLPPNEPESSTQSHRPKTAAISVTPSGGKDSWRQSHSFSLNDRSTTKRGRLPQTDMPRRIVAEAQTHYRASASSLPPPFQTAVRACCAGEMSMAAALARASLLFVVIRGRRGRRREGEEEEESGSKV